MMLPWSELLERAAKYAEPGLILDVNFPGIQLPEALSRTAHNGEVFMPLNEDVCEAITFHPELAWFDVKCTERFHVPGGAILDLMDGSTGERITLKPRRGAPN